MNMPPLDHSPAPAEHAGYSGSYGVPEPKKHVEMLVERDGVALFFKRWAATVIDFLFWTALVFAAFNFRDAWVGYGLGAVALLWLLYYLLLEGMSGYTIGKLLLRIRVVREDGYAPGFVKGLLRTLLRAVDTNPLLVGGLPAGICVLATRKKQRLGDMAADTYVVNVKDLKPAGTAATAVAIAASAAALAAALVGAAFGIGHLVQKASAPPEEAVFRSADGRFQIAADDSWSALKGLNDEADISIGNIFKEKYLIVLAEPKADFEEDITLEDYYWLVESYFVDSDEFRTIEGPDAVTIQGMPAYQSVIGGVVDDMSIRYVMTTVETRTHYYQLIAWTLTSKFGELEEELRRVAGSFRESFVTL